MFEGYPHQTFNGATGKWDTESVTMAELFVAGDEVRRSPVVVDRLYGEPGAEHMCFDPAEVYENLDIEAPLTPDYTIEIEEWSVSPPTHHMPSAERALEYIVEWTGENGQIDEDANDQWIAASAEPDVVAMMQAALDLLASKVTYRMADKLLRTLTVTFAETGEPLLDGEPLYVKAAGS